MTPDPKDALFSAYCPDCEDYYAIVSVDENDKTELHTACPNECGYDWLHGGGEA